MATIAVISFAVLAGGSRRSGFFAYRIDSVDISITIADRDLIVWEKVDERKGGKMETTKARPHKKTFVYPFLECIFGATP